MPTNTQSPTSLWKYIKPPCRVGPKAQLSEIRGAEHHSSALEKHFHNTFLHSRCNSAPSPRHSPWAFSSLLHRRSWLDRQVGWGHHVRPSAGPAPGPSPWHAAGRCATSAPHQQLGCTIVQTQEGSDSRVSRGGRNQQHRHLLVSHGLQQRNGWGQLSEGTGGRAIITSRALNKRQSCAPQHPEDEDWQFAFP